MSEIRNWVFTICGGALICGITASLVPSKSFEKMIQLLLGVFMLFCFLTPIHAKLDLPTVDVSQAEELRQQVASGMGQAAESLLLQDISHSAEEKTAELLQEYDVTPDEYAVLVVPQGDGTVKVVLRLAERLQPSWETIAARLEEALGVAVITGEG